jgi:hypothetical protein
MPTDVLPELRDLSRQTPLAQTHAVWLPDVQRTDYGWGCFRAVVQLDHAIEPSALCWSGSQRCTIWLNGERLADGPARSDRGTWQWVRTPLPALSAGQHCLAVEVHYAARYAGKGQIGGPAFWLCACTHEALAAWSSDAASWRCLHDQSRTPMLKPMAVKTKGHRAVGKGHTLNADRYPWGWQQLGFTDDSWEKPQRISETHGNPWGNRSLGCHLVAHDFPPMPRTPQVWHRLWQDDQPCDPTTISGDVFNISQPTRLIADLGFISIGYPSLRWQGGAGGTITITACETPIDVRSHKTDRNDPFSGFLPGLQDEILLASEPSSTAPATQYTWQPEWIRALRYLVLDIDPGQSPLQLAMPEFALSSYPLPVMADCTINDGRDWTSLITTNRRTAAACAHETFFDCPAWEQAQFPGDSRIQARHHYLVGNDDRLALKAIRDLAASVTASGLLRSHWPSSFEQIISTYSLQWLGMVHDHYQHFNRPSAWPDLLPHARGILQWFINRTRADGLLGAIDEAPFIDWAFEAGCPPQDSTGGSSL